MRPTGKNAPHLEKCATFEKVQHSWKNAAYCEKGEHLAPHFVSIQYTGGSVLKNSKLASDVVGAEREPLTLYLYWAPLGPHVDPFWTSISIPVWSPF